MHGELQWNRKVPRERNGQTVTGPVADPALAREAIICVERFGRAQSRPLSRIGPPLGALKFKRNDPISDLAVQSDLANEPEAASGPANLRA